MDVLTKGKMIWCGARSSLRPPMTRSKTRSLPVRRPGATARGAAPANQNRILLRLAGTLGAVPFCCGSYGRLGPCYVEDLHGLRPALDHQGRQPLEIKAISQRFGG